jgi:hypothetical protein
MVILAAMLSLTERCDPLLADRDRTRLVRIQAEEGSHDLGPARADEAREADDLSPRDVKPMSRRRRAEPFHREQFGARGTSSLGKLESSLRPTIMR